MRIKLRLTKMKSRREWCELIGWTLAASLLAMQAPLVNAAEASNGSAVSINRGETYIIKGASPDSRPEVKSIDNPNALIVNVQPDGSVLVLGADPGVEEVIFCPVVVRTLATPTTGPRRRLEFLFSGTAVAEELTSRNVASAEVLFEGALGLLYDNDLFHIENVTTEYFAGTAYLYRVLAVE